MGTWKNLTAGGAYAILDSAEGDGRPGACTTLPTHNRRYSVVRQTGARRGILYAEPHRSVALSKRPGYLWGFAVPMEETAYADQPHPHTHVTPHSSRHAHRASPRFSSLPSSARVACVPRVRIWWSAIRARVSLPTSATVPTRTRGGEATGDIPLLSAVGIRD